MKLRSVFWLLALVHMAANGQAASPEAEFAAAQRRIEPLWRRVAAASPRTVTWAGRGAGFEAGVAGLSPGDRLAMYQEQIGQIERELAFARAIPRRVERVGEACIGAALRNCRLLAAGLLRNENATIDLRWQIQRGFTPEAGTLGGLLVMERRGQGFHPVAWSFEGYDWQAPRLIEHDDGLLLAVSGFGAGTGHGNADLLYRRVEGSWLEIGLEGWKQALPQHLPDGLAVWKGVEYDFATMTARMSLWREADGNCCPTGGQAIADLRIEGDRLVLTRVRQVTLSP